MILEHNGCVVRNEDSYFLASKQIRSNHPLNLITSTLDAHHIISDKVINSLIEFRSLQMKNKGWSMNHGINLVLLSANEKICCYYNTPQHASNHCSDSIEKNFYKNDAKLMYDLSQIQNKDFKKTIDSIAGYHKVVAIKLSLAMKELDCNTPFKEYVKKIDYVSTIILIYISRFKLLLNISGDKFKRNNVGCGKCSSRDAHFKKNEFIFFNRLADKKEFDEYTKSSDGNVIKSERYFKNKINNQITTRKKSTKQTKHIQETETAYFTSKDKNKVYEDIYKEVKDHSFVRGVIFNNLEMRLNNVYELKVNYANKTVINIQ